MKNKPNNQNEKIDIWTLMQFILIIVIIILLYLGYQSDLENQKILEENYYNVPFKPFIKL